jgi:APA family basic amino acid/polyamine antiporter
MFGRVKPLDAILATAEKKSLHRSLGAFQLTMLGVGPSSARVSSF